MIVELIDDQWLWFTQILPHEENILWQHFSVAAPGIEYIDMEASRWDGVYRFYNRSRQRMARPLLSMLKRICREHNLIINIIDRRPDAIYQPIDPITIRSDFLPGITLENYQVDAIRVACKIECGIFWFPTGSGKTELIAGICKAIECPTLILANQKVVIDQLKERLELRDVAEEVGLFYAGKRPDGQMIVVGSIQSLIAPTKKPNPPTQTSKDTQKIWAKKVEKHAAQLKGLETRKKNTKILQKYAKEAHMIMIDEVDLCSSKLYQQVFRNLCRARRRYGFSGTPFDIAKPVENMRVQSHIGSIIAMETRETVQALNRIIPVKYYMLVVGGDPKEASTYDIAFKEHITQSEYFWKLVTALCQLHPTEGTLILVDKEELGKNLSTELAASGIIAPFIYGRTPKKKRDEALKQFQERAVNVLIGGKIINRGLDLKSGCENMILATGGKMQSDFIQKLGRAVRHNSLGFARAYDFYFRGNRYLYAHSRARLHIVTELGYETTVIYPGGKISGQELINRKFRLPNK